MQFASGLWSHADVSQHAQAILGRLAAGTMPCDGPWPGAAATSPAIWGSRLQCPCKPPGPRWAASRKASVGGSSWLSARNQPRPAAARPVRLGLRANWPQSTVLVVVNVFADGMIGVERASTSLVGTRVFHLSGYLAVLSFIIAFGVTKEPANLAAGPLTARQTRKVLLVAGWAVGLPVPFLLAWAPAWGWIVAAQEKTDVFRRWVHAGKPAQSRA